jgi:DNA-binding response OmpR family regulator
VPEKKKILIIDDEPDFCQLVKSNLEDTQEYDVQTCSNPEQAEEAIGQMQPDLILLDNVMPKKDGAQIAKDLHKNTKFHHIPIIMVSGRGEMVYIRKKDQFRWMPNTSLVEGRGKVVDSKSPEILAKAYGVDDYVAKPFSTTLLLQVIREVLKRSESSLDKGTPRESDTM